jgi:aspartate racemase
MAQHIGIVACSAEGAALCYRNICLEALAVMGEHNHPEVTMNSIPMAKFMPYFYKNDLESIAEIMLESTHKVAKAGAEFAVCPDNTCHMVFDLVVKDSPIPWLHIAEVVAEEATKNHFKRIGVLGTKYLMESDVYPKVFDKYNLAYEIPSDEDREKINTIIFKELVNGIILEDSRLYFNEVIQKFKEQGCDAVTLSCTEIPLIVRLTDCPLPSLDSTRLLAKAALSRALN